MRRLLFLLMPCLLALCLLPDAASRGETVTATASEDFLAGAWSMVLPAGPLRQGLHMRFGPGARDFCRLEGPSSHLRAHCLGLAGEGVVTRAGKRIRIVWGGAMRRTTIDAEMTDYHGFAGLYAVRLYGVTFRAPQAARAIRRAHLENVPDTGGKSFLLESLLAHPARAPKGVVLPAKDMGAAQRLIHMGRTPEAAEVYAVQLESGLRLCAIHQGRDGAVDQLRCV